MRKNIYVVEEDYELFEWAMKVGDNLSAVISEALRYARDRQIRFTNHREIKEKQMDLHDSLREHEYRMETLEALNSIANSLRSIALFQDNMVANQVKGLELTERMLVNQESLSDAAMKLNKAAEDVSRELTLLEKDI